MFNKKSINTSTQYEIAFANFGWLHTDIFIAEGDGNNPHPLCPSPGLDYNASFSAEGNWVIFTSNRNGSSDIWRVHPDGSGLEQLTNDPAFDDRAVFAPDGKMIAFVSSRERQADIYIMDLATKKTRNLTQHPAGDFRPSGSPDGKSIAFSTDRDSKKPKPVLPFGILPKCIRSVLMGRHWRDEPLWWSCRFHCGNNQRLKFKRSKGNTFNLLNLVLRIGHGN